ncbi:Atxe2 family lasso peptide isopeptidase [Sphingobium sp. PNB]|uniref:Atxe2 family lasso peptide isopeptidase n=1 Tax=Sphingobium sp. PNB TaxID=863934 RepID=UPI001CA39526|nr:Atxe2 family lasso peptide isopeptidase [Sphingobium sp. PNB]
MERYEVDLATGRERLLDRLDQSLRNGGFDSTLRAVSLDGRVAWAHGPEGSPDDRAYIKVNESDHTSRLCRATACSGVDVLWWTSDGRRVQFIRREGWAASEMAVYEWQPRRKSPVRLYSTPDLLIDCQPANERLICAREQSTVPRQVILLDPRTGLADILFDPNPTFRKFALGEVERLNLRNAFGLESFGDLIYPVGYEPGKRYPLIVVQYVSRGFLRGGVGDEFPIQVFANHGFAVLSVQRPDFQIPKEAAADRIGRERWRLQDFKDRRSVLSSIEAAVETLIRRGIADRERIGITGLSDGSSTVQFAALNSRLFRAGSVSGCCWDPFQDAFFGPATSDMYHQIGWPTLANYRSEFWSHISLIEGASRVGFPILMQQADSEFRGAVASFTALRQAEKPAALYVFPNEYHVKWQPVHRLAVYERNLKWFNFWLCSVGEPGEWNP